MTILPPSRFCPICGAEVSGRPDKVFCSVKCKNAYHRDRKAKRNAFSYPVDAILHRNWVILTEAHELARKKKFFVSRAVLEKEGFKPDYHTTAAINKDGKQYFYVYDFGWMEFSDKELMVVKLNKPK